VEQRATASSAVVWTNKVTQFTLHYYLLRDDPSVHKVEASIDTQHCTTTVK